MLSPEDGVNILGPVTDTGDPVDASDDGLWNDNDPAVPRAFVCCTGTCSTPATPPAPAPSAAVTKRSATIAVTAILAQVAVSILSGVGLQ